MTPVIAVTPQPDSLPNRDRRTRLFAEAISDAGGEPLLIEGRSAALPQCDGLLLVGGGDPDARYYESLTDAERQTLGYVDESLDEMELSLVREAAKRRLPVLGICRGMQMINLALGGSLLPDIKLRRPDALKHQHPDPLTLAHAVEWQPKSRLGRLLKDSCAFVNSSHHQAIDRVAEGLTISARAPDGIIEAIEKRDAPFFCGVQFHPERMKDLAPGALRLFEVFVAAARGKP